ncbi:hypothetical protein FB45DRAFT_1143876 [Roridomyces roridus]|uniref:Uncharacterized protein n=1 Tax=Roridomyces roridus TaxID=1738132 RepID=A0AAD7AZY2_9AGAR|nr:hypothetical protein FB45DRAFT_1143876 [Roridomyces roridus]
MARSPLGQGSGIGQQVEPELYVIASYEAPAKDKSVSTGSGIREWDPWPSGTWNEKYKRRYYDECKFTVHWACEARGSGKNETGSKDAETEHGAKHVHRVCLGVMKCTSALCEVITRPQTKQSGRNQQLDNGCSCGHPLQWHGCDAEMKYWVWRNGARFKHSGYHNHEPPPTRHLTAAERARFAKMVKAHPRVGPAKLIAGIPGVDGPGESVLDISPVFVNPQRVQYERAKILKPANSTRDERLLPKIRLLQEQNPTWTIALHWADKIHMIIFQSPWQHRMGLQDMIKSEAVNGTVSDACHGYFLGNNQLLFISSAFDPIHLKSWVPILMTYSNGAKTVNYRIHFLHLFRGMARECQARSHAVTDRLFANVVDFSDAQRNGFIQAFVDFWLEFSPEARDERELLQAAEGLLKGCRGSR